MKLIELSKLFNVSYGNKLDLYKMNITTRSTAHSLAFVARTRENNGIVAYVEQIADIMPYPKGSITVALGGSVLSSFIQYDDFYTAQNVAVLDPIEEMSEQTKIFYCVAIMENAFRYSTCGREANKTLKTLMVPDISEIPPFVADLSTPNYSDMTKPMESGKYNIDVLEWHKFRYDDIFSVKKGKRVTKLDLIPGNTPFLSAIDKNNGVRELAGLTPLYDGNAITVNYNGSVGEAFYQERPFWASDDVNVLIPKFELNKYIAMFLIALIRHEKYRFNYGRKWHKERMEESTIMLPVTADGNPDYAFMECYIKSLPYSVAI